MCINWKVVAEVLSLFSGLSLAWPALRLNQWLRKAKDVAATTRPRQSKFLKQFRNDLAKAYTEQKWNAWDHYLTIGGVALFILASLVNLLLVD